MPKEKIDQVLEEILSLKEGQQKNHDLIQKNHDLIQKNYDLIQKNGVKIEQVASDVKAVAEGHQVIRSEMRQMKEEILTEVKENKSAIKFVADKVNNIDRKLDEHIRQPAVGFGCWRNPVGWLSR